MAPGTRFAPGDEYTVALASGVTYCSRSKCALGHRKSAGRIFSAGRLQRGTGPMSRRNSKIAERGGATGRNGTSRILGAPRAYSQCLGLPPERVAARVCEDLPGSPDT